MLTMAETLIVTALTPGTALIPGHSTDTGDSSDSGTALTPGTALTRWGHQLAAPHAFSVGHKTTVLLTADRTPAR